jgi:hypothetical protein
MLAHGEKQMQLAARLVEIAGKFDGTAKGLAFIRTVSRARGATQHRSPGSESLGFTI